MNVRDPGREAQEATGSPSVMVYTKTFLPFLSVIKIYFEQLNGAVDELVYVTVMENCVARFVQYF